MLVYSTGFSSTHVFLAPSSKFHFYGLLLVVEYNYTFYIVDFCTLESSAVELVLTDLFPVQKWRDPLLMHHVLKDALLPKTFLICLDYHIRSHIDFGPLHNV